MAHRLEPPDGKAFHSPDRIVKLLRYEFEYVREGPDDEVIISNGEAAPDYLSFVVRTNQAILIEYDSPQHEAATCAFLDRCANALGYATIRVS